jgi:hypothetical protein
MEEMFEKYRYFKILSTYGPLTVSEYVLWNNEKWNHLML